MKIEDVRKPGRNYYEYEYTLPVEENKEVLDLIVNDILTNLHKHLIDVNSRCNRKFNVYIKYQNTTQKNAVLTLSRYNSEYTNGVYYYFIKEYAEDFIKSIQNLDVKVLNSFMYYEYDDELISPSVIREKFGLLLYENLIFRTIL